METKQKEDDEWVSCVPETDIVPRGPMKFNVIRCKKTSTWAKYIKIKAKNPNKSKLWVLVLNEVKVFGADGFAVVNDALVDLLGEIF